MITELGRLEITLHLKEPQIQTAGAGIPPRDRVGIGSGFSGGSGDIPPGIRASFGEHHEWKPQLSNKERDATIFWAIHDELKREMEDPTTDPWLIREIEDVGLAYADSTKALEPVSREAVRRFLKEAKRMGLVKRRFDPRRLLGSIIPPFLRLKAA